MEERKKRVMRFAERRVLVTGGSRGIGRAVVQMFAEEGARVAVHYHQNRKAAEETCGGLAGEGHLIVQADLMDADAIRAAVDTVIAGFGGVDILVNNAGIFVEHPIADVSFEEWEDGWNRTIGTNLIGPSITSYWVVKQMIGQGGGCIINISSRGAFRGEPDAPAYGASKAGLNAMGQSLAQALAPHRIYVYTIAPGWILTDMAADFLAGPGGEDIRRQSPMERVGTPEEIARTVLFLAEDGTEFLTGCIVDANGASYLRT